MTVQPTIAPETAVMPPVSTTAPTGGDALAALPPGLRRAAVTLYALGKDHAAQVLAQMDPEEVTALTKAVLSVGAVPAAEVRASLENLADGMGQLSSLTAPNESFMADVLTAALGPDRGPALLAELTRPAPFAWVPTVDKEVLARVLQEESAASVAIALAHIDPDTGAGLLRRLTAEKRAEIAARIAGLETVSEATVRDVDTVMLEQVGTATAVARARVDGVETLTALLTRSPRKTTDAVLDELATSDPALAAKVKEALFTMDDVLNLERRTVQKVLAAVDMRTLALALFGADEVTSSKVFENITERSAVVLREEVDLATAVRAADVRTARQSVVAKALEMEQAGDIVIEFGPEEDDAA